MSPPPERADWLRSMVVRTVGALLRFGSMAAIAFPLFGVILLVSGQDPILSYRDLFVSTFGSARGFSEVLVAMTPMLLTALAVALPSRIVLINVGGDGQLYQGGCVATW